MIPVNMGDSFRDPVEHRDHRVPDVPKLPFPRGDRLGHPVECFREIFQLVAEGRSNKEVADVLGISVKTAMSHREHVMEKLGVHNRTELVRFAIRRGVIRVDE